MSRYGDSERPYPQRTDATRYVIPAPVPADGPGGTPQPQGAPTPLKRPSFSARVVVLDNGLGLSRDRDIITRALERAGWDVAHLSPKKEPTEDVALQIFAEIPIPGWFGRAKQNVIIPNPEWWEPHWTPFLRAENVVVWAKTDHAVEVFRGLGAKVERLGFTSLDRRAPDAVYPCQPARAFLHVAGKSLWKGTAALVAAWDADWPPLTVVASGFESAKAPPANVRIITQRLDDAQLEALQNRHLFHIYPSRQEGFGHALWEGLSCGAVVIIPKGTPPFDEYPEAFERMAGAMGPAGFEVSAEAISEAAERVYDFGHSERDVRQVASREAWEDNNAAFSLRIEELLDGEARRLGLPVPIRRRVVEGPLAHLPPMIYAGRVNCVTGHGEAARHQIWLLKKAGLRLKILDIGSSGEPDPDGLSAFVRESRRDSLGIDRIGGTIIHHAPNCAQDFRAAHPDLPRPHILVSAWETTLLPAAWVGIANTFDQVWCATEWQAGVYLDSGVEAKRVKVVPFALDPKLCPSEGPHTEGGLRGRGGFIFGSVFQWSERKAPGILIDAYLRAFKGDEQVTLILKSYEGEDAKTSVENRVMDLVQALRPEGIPPRIVVISRRLPREEMLALYRTMDCYVSAHRGEGFGFPIAESLIVGTPVIATNWSAPAEYAAGCFMPVEYDMETPHGMDWQPFYADPQQWAAPRVESLAGLMRAAFEGRMRYDRPLVESRFAALRERAISAARSALGSL